MPLDQRSDTKSVELSVIVPSFNERDNIAPLLRGLDQALAGIAWEVVFVDDDLPDGTAAAIRDIAQRDPRVRCLRRIGRRGLSTAVIEGMLASSALPISPSSTPICSTTRPCCRECWRRLAPSKLDIVVGSRYLDGGGVGDWSTRRAGISRFATRLAPARRPGRADRPDERLLPDHPPRFRAGGAPALRPRLQDPARPLRLRATPYRYPSSPTCSGRGSTAKASSTASSSGNT